MSTFHLFPELPKELRLQIYESAFEARILQLGVDAGVPFPPEMKPLGRSAGPEKVLHTRLPSLFAVCKESRDICRSTFVPFGPTFVHPRLDTLYISLYAAGRMGDTRFKSAYNDDGSSAYSVAAFDKVAVEYDVKDRPQDVAEWIQKPKKWQIKNGEKELCVPGKWPATDYADFLRSFGAPREVLLVSNGVMKWFGGFSKTTMWRKIEIVPTKMESSDQEKMIESLKVQLSSSLAEGQLQFTVVDAVKEQAVMLSSPYGWRTWLDMTEKYIW